MPETVLKRYCFYAKQKSPDRASWCVLAGTARSEEYAHRPHQGGRSGVRDGDPRSEGLALALDEIPGTGLLPGRSPDQDRSLGAGHVVLRADADVGERHGHVVHDLRGTVSELGAHDHQLVSQFLTRHDERSAVVLDEILDGLGDEVEPVRIRVSAHLSLPVKGTKSAEKIQPDPTRGVVHLSGIVAYLTNFVNHCKSMFEQSYCSCFEI